MNLTERSRRKVAAIVVGTVIACGFLALVTTRGCVGDMGVVERTEHVEAAGIRNLVIDLPAGRLRVSEAPAGQADIVVSERASGTALGQASLECAVEGDTLSIGYRVNPLAWLPIYWLGGGQRELEVTVPPAVLDELQGFRLQNSSGESQVSGLRCQNAEVSVSSGRAVLDEVSVGERASLRLSSGELRVTGGALGSCDLRVSSGSAQVSAAMDGLGLAVSSGQARVACEGADLDRVDVELTSGTVELRLPRDLGFDAAVSKVSGSFTCGFDASVRGETYAYGDGGTPIDIRITSGNMTLAPL